VRACQSCMGIGRREWVNSPWEWVCPDCLGTGRGWADEPTVAPIPLRASCRALVARVHLDAAREQRDNAHHQRRAALRVSGSDEESVTWWRETLARSAEEADARAAEHERIATAWGGQ